MCHDVSLHIRFELCYAGILPKGFKKFEQIAEVCNSLVRVSTATIPGSCIPCEANPFDFLCTCKGARKIGICAHILLVTHEEMKGTPRERRKPVCNLKYMTTKIAGGKRKLGRPTTVKHCLIRDDSSDSDDDTTLRLTW